MSPPPSSGTSLAATGGQHLLRRLRWAALLVPLVLALALELSHALLDPVFSPWVDRLLVITTVLVIALLFYQFVFAQLELLQNQLTSQNRELLGLHGASLSVAADLSLDSVLQTVVDNARELLRARYGALSVIRPDRSIRLFLHSGLDPATAEAMGDPPQGRGLLGAPLHQGQRIRLESIQDDPRSVGFPPRHPPMRSLLAVPITGKSPYRGNLYLSEKLDGSAFTAEEEETLVRFAHQAAIAIDNAYLHHQVRELSAARERIRIAHEMHDGLAQVLAYVNTKSQVVQEYCRQGKIDVAEVHMKQLSEAAREVYEDVRGHILELRTATPSEIGLLEALRQYTDKWQRHSQVELEVELPETLDLSPEIELQLLRIVQESLTNVRKHAQARQVSLAVTTENDRVRVVISDDGRGLAGDRSALGPHSPRFGLTTMRERAEAVGGTLDLTSARGEGTRITVVLPYTSVSKEGATHAPTPG